MIKRFALFVVFIVLSLKGTQTISAAPQFAVPKGKFAFTVSGDTKTAGLYIMNTDGTEQTMIGSAGCSPVWSPNAKQIAYVYIKSDKLTDYSLTNYCIGTILILTEQEDYYSSRAIFKFEDQSSNPTWAADGNKLAFMADRAIHVVRTGNIDADEANWMGNDSILTIELSGLEIGSYGLAWSPDGKKLAYAFAGGMLHHIAVMEIADFTLKIKRFSNSGGAPKWSPDGKWIAYIPSNDSSGPHISSSDGKRLLTPSLITQLLEPFDLAWSPDSKRLAMASDEVYIVNTSGAAPIKLTHNGLVADKLLWLPGNVIALISRNDHAIYLVNTNNGQQIKLTDGLNVTGFSWVRNK